MGYFSNGTEGDDYRAQWCDRCANDGDEKGPGCAVWDAHLMYVSSSCRNEGQRAVLNVLIPMREEIWNEQCAMFREKPEGVA